MTRCVICTTERSTTVGLLCESHYNRAHQWLIDIETEAAVLSAVKPMQAGDGSHDTSPAFTRSPARLDVLVHNDPRHGTGKSEDEDDELAAGDTLSILNVLHSWARVVREDRDLAQPDRVTVVGERGLLSAHLDWIAAQPWVDEFVAELRQLRGQLKAANGTQDEKPYGRCYLPTEAGTCDGPIWLDWAHGHAHCGRCRQTWDGQQLAMMKAELDHMRAEAARPRTDDGRLMLTATELVAKGYVTSLVNVRVIAHRRRIVSVDGHYDPEEFGERIAG